MSCFFPRLLSSWNGKCGCAIWNNFTVRLYKNLSCRKWSVLLFLFQLVASKVLHRFMLVVLHTVLLASETKQHCGLCLRYSAGTCCRAEKAGEYSKGKTAFALAFVLKVNLMCNQPSFLMILSQHLVLFALLWRSEGQLPTVLLSFPELTMAEMNFLKRLPTSLLADHHWSPPLAINCPFSHSWPAWHAVREPVSTVLKNFAVGGI